MKQLLAFLMLIVHVNSAMFLPQVDATVDVNSIGKSSDVVNSIYEWIDESLLDHHDSSTQDEHDSDDGLQIETSVADDFCSHMAFVEGLINPVMHRAVTNRYGHIVSALEMSYETHTPPPDFL